jgi:xanthine/uracil permease
MDNIIVFIALITLLFSVICIYGARGIVKSKVTIENENRVVLGLKIVCFILVIISLSLLCYFR